jgi:acetyl-CoA synthetase
MRRLGIETWQELVDRSVKDIEWFWTATIPYLGIHWSKPYQNLLDLSGGFSAARWFSGGQLNIAANCLEWHLNPANSNGCRVSAGPDHPALIWCGEDGQSTTLSYRELNALSNRVANTLQALKVEPGDAVGIYMPMVPETVAVFFGCFKVGAVAVPIFSGFGPKPLASRLQDCKAKVLFTADAGIRRAGVIPIKKDADEAANEVPSLRHVITLDHCHSQIDWNKNRDLHWSDTVATASAEFQSLDLDSQHYSMYLYTSGTTGTPKGTVHTHGGALAEIGKELGFVFDVHPNDVFFWLTDIGWMMGPWEMIGVSFWGGTMVIAEGAPNYPQPDRLWKIIEKHKVTTLGISPTVVRVLRPDGDNWVEQHNLSSLRFLGSTGEPWDEDNYMWLFEKVGKKRCPIMNISGGTELVGCLLQPLPIMPLKPCSLGTQGLAVAADVVDDAGHSISNSIGHLICRKPVPSMTRGFVRDQKRYLETYFSQFPDIWYHGDWAKVDEDGLWFLYGRSDDTIKIAGKRIGPAEAEAALLVHPAVAQAAAIGVPHKTKGEALVGFVVLRNGAGAGLNDAGAPLNDICTELITHTAAELGSSFRPEQVHVVSMLPHTRSGKIVRAAIKKAYLHEELGDTSSVENLDSLQEISRLRRP